MKLYKIKSTGQRVTPLPYIGKDKALAAWNTKTYARVLIPRKTPTRGGNFGDIAIVRKSNLEEVKTR